MHRLPAVGLRRWLGLAPFISLAFVPAFLLRELRLPGVPWYFEGVCAAGVVAICVVHQRPKSDAGPGVGQRLAVGLLYVGLLLARYGAARLYERAAFHGFSPSDGHLLVLALLHALTPVCLAVPPVMAGLGFLLPWRTIPSLLPTLGPVFAVSLVVASLGFAAPVYLVVPAVVAGLGLALSWRTIPRPLPALRLLLAVGLAVSSLGFPGPVHIATLAASGYLGYERLKAPVALLFVVLVWLALRRHERLERDAPSPRQVVLALGAYALAFACACAAYQLPWGLRPLAEHVRAAYPGWGAFLVSSGSSVAFVLPCLLAVPIFLPWQSVRRLVPAVGTGGVSLLGFGAVQVLQNEYYPALGDPLAAAVRGLLAFLPFGRSVEGSGVLISYGRYTVTMGAPCLGLDGFFLFAALFAAACWLAARARRVSAPRAAVALAAAFVVLAGLNVVRITAIMVFGDRFPDAATDIFHEGIGGAFVVLLLLVYLRWVLPWTYRREKR